MYILHVFRHCVKLERSLYPLEASYNNRVEFMAHAEVDHWGGEAAILTEHKQAAAG